MKKSQLKSILDAQFNSIVVEKFDIKEIRKTIRSLRIQMTEHFRNGQRVLSRLVADAIEDLVAEVKAHHERLVINMTA